MRFSAILSSALLVGIVAAAPAPNKASDMMESSSAMPAETSASYMPSDSKKSDDSKYYQSDNSKLYQSDNSNSYKSDDSYKSDESTSTDEYKMQETSTEQSYESSSTQMEYATSTQEYATTTQDSYQTATSTAEASSVTYGSGHMNWGGSGYNDCVQQCVASYGAPPATWTPSSTQAASNDGQYHGSSGSGATHTVIVAPTQGVLRYVPFAVNASVGDTVLFMWNAKNHTVTKGSALELCNKTEDNPFTTGIQSAPFTFTQVVNDTNPTYFFCNAPGHCQKGMFGMINPPSAYQVPSSVSQQMSAAVQNSSDLASMQAYTDTMTGSNEKAATWGSNIDLAQMPEWAHSVVLENVLYTRSFLGANPETLKDDGSIDMSGDAPKVIPTDMAPVNNAVDASASTQTAAQNAGSPSAPAAPAATTSAPANKDNGAASTAISTGLLGVAAFAAAVLAF